MITMRTSGTLLNSARFALMRRAKYHKRQVCRITSTLEPAPLQCDPFDHAKMASHYSAAKNLVMIPQRSKYIPATGRIVRMSVATAKFLVTAICFWYLARRIDVVEIGRMARNLNIGWAGLAALFMMLQSPVAGWRWSIIIDALERGQVPILRRSVVAITFIWYFFTQVIPNIAADTMRVWMLTRLARAGRGHWRA